MNEKNKFLEQENCYILVDGEGETPSKEKGTLNYEVLGKEFQKVVQQGQLEDMYLLRGQRYSFASLEEGKVKGVSHVESSRDVIMDNRTIRKGLISISGNSREDVVNLRNRLQKVADNFKLGQIVRILDKKI